MVKKKVLFVRAISRNEYKFHPVNFGYLISTLRDNFTNKLEFKIIDKDIIYHIKKFSPDIVCINSVSQNYNIAKKYAYLSKQFNLPVIIGGVHISCLPFTLSKDMEIGVIGEGEKTIVDIFRLFLEDRLNENSFSNIDGIVYRYDDNLKTTPRRELIKNLDEIPHPARDLFYPSKETLLFSSRGCIYNCPWCVSYNMWKTARFFSADYIVDEIEQIYHYGINNIVIADYIFIAKSNRIKKIIELLTHRKLLKKVKFFIQSIPVLIDEEVAPLLVKLNVKSVSMSIFSGSEELVSKLGNTPYSNFEVNKRAIEILKKYKIAADISFTIGYCNETKEDIKKTIKFIKNEKLDRINIFLAIPQPGTKLWEYAKEGGVVNDNINWDKLRKTLIWNGKKNKEIYRFYYHLLIIKNINNFFSFLRKLFKFIFKRRNFSK